MSRFIDRLAHVFTWWNGRTVNTAFSTWRHGERVGTDEFGNVYYRTKGGKIDPALGFERRWVIYNGYAEGSMVPTGWYGWLHHTTGALPTEEDYVPKDWQKPHLPNMTGTPRAWRPWSAPWTPPLERSGTTSSTSTATSAASTST